MHLRMNHATGLMSPAVVSQPSRIASSGIAPPPANGSSTRGARPPYVIADLLARNQSTSALPSRPQCRMPPLVSRLRRSIVRPFSPSRS